MNIQERGLASGCVVSKGRLGGAPVVLVQSGIGRARAQAAAEMVFNQVEPKGVVSMGFAGGTTPELRGGDLLIATDVHSFDPDVVASPPWYSCDAGLIDAARSAAQGRLPVHVGGLLTSSTVVGPEAKRDLGHRFPVLAVDMESYWVAEAAAKHGAPFLAVRGTSDEVLDHVPDSSGFISQSGDLRKARAAAFSLLRPHQWSIIVKLAARSARAARNLGVFGGALAATFASPEGEHTNGPA